MAGGTAGRPRDISIDQRAISATLELLEQVGFPGTTLQAVAKRAGVHASALYRRWPSRVTLIEDAVFPGLDSLSVAPRGDLRSDLRRFVRAYVTALTAPAARAAIPGLMAYYRSTGDTRPPEGYLRVSARPQFQDILCAAPTGSVDENVDPDDVFDMLLGAVIARALIPAVAARRRPLERTVDLVLRMLQPAAVLVADRDGPDIS